ncbi:MAG: IS4 family transposase [Nitrospirae bacterium]|nr:IS4 family transposase [Nitrospirota bacterium]
MAWKVLLKSCTRLIGILREKILSDEFVSKHRSKDKDFKRNRKLPFHTLLLFLINLVKGSLQDELDNFFKVLNQADTAVREVTKSALCNARKKLKYGAFQELTRDMETYVYRHIFKRKWKGFRLLAVDGSTLQVPRTAEVAEHFGVWHPADGQPCPVARISMMTDVLNDFIVDAAIKPKSIGERLLAMEHMPYMGTNDLVLFDRGYPAFWLFSKVRSRGAHFCARINKGVWHVVDDFIATGLEEYIVSLKPGAQALKQCREMGLPIEPIEVRLLRIVLDTGETEVLITSLVDCQEYPHGVFKELYGLRWGIEETYKTAKNRLQFENWSGKSVDSVYQDFYAKVFALNLTITLTHPADEEIKTGYQERKHPYQINMTQALSKMKDTVVLLFKVENPFSLLTQLMDVFLKAIEPIRKGRRYPRKKRMGYRRFATCYKQVS